jgi:phage/plasmid-like protein (TIGR03299 family)|tara:strand:+ start:6114 stop:7070 length:957 start_codon:yes stop_codon:yes gene_type:complete
MGHGLTETDWMAYAGQAPWHRLGTKVGEGLGTAEEFLKASHLDYEVYTETVHRPHGELIPNKQSIVREDTQEVFEIMGKIYTPVQNRDAFSFFDDVVGTGEAVYETAGSLNGGRRIWIMANLQDSRGVKGTDDEIANYLLLSNSHDGTEEISMRWAPMRVVCANTLAIALRQGDKTKWAARHTANVMKRAYGAREVLGFAKYYQDQLMDQIDVIASKQWVASDMDAFLEHVFDYNSAEDIKTHHSKLDAANNVRELFEGGIGMDIKGIGGTAYAGYQALTEHIDRHRNVKTDDSAVFSSWFGPMAKLRQQAWNYVVAV